MTPFSSSVVGEISPVGVDVFSFCFVRSRECEVNPVRHWLTQTSLTLSIRSTRPERWGRAVSCVVLFTCLLRFYSAFLHVSPLPSPRADSSPVLPSPLCLRFTHTSPPWRTMGGSRSESVSPGSGTFCRSTLNFRSHTLIWPGRDRDYPRTHWSLGRSKPSCRNVLADASFSGVNEGSHAFWTSLSEVGPLTCNGSVVLSISYEPLS